MATDLMTCHAFCDFVDAVLQSHGRDAWLVAAAGAGHTALVRLLLALGGQDYIASGYGISGLPFIDSEDVHMAAVGAAAVAARVAGHSAVVMLLAPRLE